MHVWLAYEIETRHCKSGVLRTEVLSTKKLLRSLVIDFILCRLYCDLLYIIRYFSSKKRLSTTGNLWNVAT